MPLRTLITRGALAEVAAGTVILVGGTAVLCTGVRLPYAFNLLSLPGRDTLTQAGGSLIGGLAGPLGLSVAVFGALSCAIPIRRISTMGVVLVGFALALSELWGSGASTVPVVGGFLPNSDARGYVIEASRLIEGTNLTPAGSRRPLAGAYLAGMLWLSGNNLRIAVSLLGLVTGISFALLLIQARRQFGATAASIAFLVLFLFYRRYLGSTVSESCGITFGALGLALLLDGFERQKTLQVGLGTICVATGLAARAGAFFIMPCLMLAILWHFRTQKARSVRVAALAVGCMATVAAANVGVFKVLGAREGVMFSNLGITLYGTIHGGDWTLAYRQHPELLAIPEGRQGMAVYRLVWREIRQKPSLAWTGATRAWKDFFTNRHGPFSYAPNQALEKLLLLLAALGLGFAVYEVRRRSDSCLILCGAVGVVLSIPFAPAWDSDNMRAYAVTVPFFALLSGSGTTALYVLLDRSWHRFLPHPRSTARPSAASPHLLVVMASLMLFCLYPLPLFVRFLFAHKQPTEFRLEAGQAEIAVTLKLGNLLRIVPDTAPRTYLPDVRESDFLQRLGYYGIMWHEQADYLRRLVPHDPMFVVPGSTGLAFIVIRTRAALAGERLHLHGKVHSVVDGDFFVEDGIP